MTRSRVHLRLAMITCSAVVLALTIAPRALAAEVLVRSCSQAAGIHWTMGNPGWVGSYLQAPAPGATTGSCPSGMSFTTSAPVPQDTQAAWQFIAPWNASVSHIKFDYEGGETTGGWRYSVSTCSSDCTTIGTLPERGANDPPATWEHGVSGFFSLAVTANCTALLCSPSVPLKFHDVVFTILDETPPTSTVVVPSFWTQRKNIFAAAVIGDSGGSGLADATARIDSGTPFLDAGNCDLDFLYQSSPFKPADYPCRQSVSRPYQQLDLSGVADGTHYIKVDAKDVAGNVSPTESYVFRIDDTPPSTPEDPVFTGVPKLESSPFRWTALPSVGVSWVNRTENSGSFNQSGVARSSYERVPHPPTTGAPIKVVGVAKASLPNISLPSDGLWDIYVTTVDQAGNESGALKLVVGRDSGVPAPPALNENSWLSESALGTQSWAPGSGGTAISGICGHSIAVNSTADSEPPAQISDAGATTSWRLPPGLSEGIHWLHMRAISCAGVASPTARKPIRIDRSAPAVSVGGLPTTEWSNTVVQAEIEAIDPLSGVATIDYRLDQGSGLRSTDSHVAIAIGEGEHEFKVDATDAAGNTSVQTRRHVNVDLTPPIASIDSHDRSQPTKITGSITDGLSGVAAAEVQYRLVDPPGSAWSSLPTATQTGGTGAKSIAFGATIPDGSMSDGHYAFRIVAVDCAGNSAVDPPVQQLELPLRQTPSLTARLAVVEKRCFTARGRVCTKRSACRRRGNCKLKPVTDELGARQSRTTAFAQPVELLADIRDQQGRPIADRDLKVYSAIGGQSPTLQKSLTSDVNGRVRMRIGAGASRRFIVRSEAGSMQFGATASADLGVAVAVTLRVSKRRVRNGQSVKFFGELDGASDAYSPKGLLAVLEYFKPGAGWKPAVDRPKIDGDGRYSSERYTFVGELKRPKTVKFRTFVNTERTGYPFVEGYSNTVAIRVSP